MRPRLTVAGLRSYRDAQIIDFTDRDLVAIIGDTGAGKSSLLEAITYALYGRSTWSGQPGDLISDYADTMRVEMEFRAAGGTWKVARAMRKRGTPLAHRLDRLDSSEPPISGSGPVTKRITELVGLDEKAFLQTVLLPQGKFDELLKSTPAERTKILKNIFSVDVLERARDQAHRLAEHFSPHLNALVTVRKTFPEDPRALAEEYEKKAEGASQQVKRLGDLLDRLREIDKQAGQAEESSGNFSRLAERLTDEALGTPLKGIERVVSQATELEGKREDARKRAGEATAQANKSRQELVAAKEEAGGDRAFLSRTDSALESLEEALQRLRDQAISLRDLRTAVEKAKTDLDHAQEGAVQAQEAAAAAVTRSQDAGALASEAVERARKLKTSLDNLLAADEDVKSKATALAEAEQAVHDRQSALEDREKDLHNARDGAAKAKAELQQMQRAHAAAHASEGLTRGDPCPVCARPLPRGFIPKEEPQLATAEKRHNQTEKLHREAERKHTTAVADFKHAQKKTQETRQELETAQVGLNAKRMEVAQISGKPLARAAVGSPDEAIAFLAPFSREEGKLQKAYEDLDTDSRNKGNAAAKAKSDGEAAQKLVEERSKNLWRQHREAESLAKDVAEKVENLPKSWRAGVIGLEKVVADAAPEAVQHDIEDVRQRLQQRIERLETIEEQVENAEGAERQARTAYDGFRKQHEEKVDQPLRAAIDAAIALSERASEGARLVGRKGPASKPGETSSVEEKAKWASAVRSSAESLAQATHQRAAESLEKAGSLRAEGEQLLGKAGYADIVALQGAHNEVVGARRLALQESEKARAQIPQVEDLDRRILEGGQFIEILSLVRSKLLDGAFIGELVTRRQRALLGIATQVLV